jgi:hypothetical protein
MNGLAALVVNDAVGATLIGASFTASLALMAWIVKSLILLTTQVSGIERRVEELETARGGRHGHTSQDL